MTARPLNARATFKPPDTFHLDSWFRPSLATLHPQHQATLSLNLIEHSCIVHKYMRNTAPRNRNLLLLPESCICIVIFAGLPRIRKAAKGACPFVATWTMHETPPNASTDMLMCAEEKDTTAPVGGLPLAAVCLPLL